MSAVSFSSAYVALWLRNGYFAPSAETPPDLLPQLPGMRLASEALLFSARFARDHFRLTELDGSFDYDFFHNESLLSGEIATLPAIAFIGYNLDNHSRDFNCCSNHQPAAPGTTAFCKQRQCERPLDRLLIEGPSVVIDPFSYEVVYSCRTPCQWQYSQRLVTRH